MLGENIKFFRQKKGYSRPKLAKAAGLNMRTIETIEWGIAKEPRITTIEKIAKALDVTVNDLIK